MKKRDRNRQNSSSSSNSGNEGKHINVAKQTSKHQHNLEVQLGSEEHVLNEKDSFKNRKNFGLFVSFYFIKLSINFWYQTLIPIT